MGPTTAGDGKVSVEWARWGADCTNCFVEPYTDFYFSATPVYRSGPTKGKQANVPDRPPPQGYVCYRCGEKGNLRKFLSLSDLF